MALRQPWIPACWTPGKGRHSTIVQVDRPVTWACGSARLGRAGDSRGFMRFAGKRIAGARSRTLQELKERHTLRLACHDDRVVCSCWVLDGSCGEEEEVVESGLGKRYLTWERGRAILIMLFRRDSEATINAPIRRAVQDGSPENKTHGGLQDGSRCYGPRSERTPEVYVDDVDFEQKRSCGNTSSYNTTLKPLSWPLSCTPVMYLAVRKLYATWPTTMSLHPPTNCATSCFSRSVSVASKSRVSASSSLTHDCSTILITLLTACWTVKPSFQTRIGTAESTSPSATSFFREARSLYKQTLIATSRIIVCVASCSHNPELRPRP